MSSSMRRQLIATAVIGVAVCVGGSVVLSGPAKKQLAEARGRVASLNAQLRDAEAARDGMAQYTSALARLREEARSISAAGAMARDERQLFSALMASAAAHRIRIDQLNPAKAAASTPAPGAAGAAPVAGDRDVAVGYSMTAIGSYGDIAAFLRSLRTEFGFSTVRSVRLTPTADDQHPTVRAVIETSHYAFDAAPVASAAPADPARLSQAGGQ